MATKESYTDSYIRHQVRIENLKEGEARTIAAFLKTVHQDLIEKLKSQDDPWTRARVVEATAAYQSAVEQVYKDSIIPSTRKDGLQFTQKNIGFHTKALTELSPSAATGVVSVAAPTATSVFVAANAEPFKGKLFSQWTAELARSDVARVSQQLRVSWIEGESVSAAAERVSPILRKSENNLKTVARSYFGHLNYESRNEVFKANDDIVEGQVWTSILDGRTTQNICAPRDQKLYTMRGEPIGHELPWGEGPGQIHWNCRSLAIPKIAGVDEAYKRPAVGAGDDYESGDMTTDRGTVRKPTRANTDSKIRGTNARGDSVFEVKTVNTATDYEKWMGGQPAAFQDDALGKARGEAFRNGEWSYGQPFTPQNPTTASNF